MFLLHIANCIPEVTCQHQGGPRVKSRCTCPHPREGRGLDGRTKERDLRAAPLRKWAPKGGRRGEPVGPLESDPVERIVRSLMEEAVRGGLNWKRTETPDKGGRGLSEGAKEAGRPRVTALGGTALFSWGESAPPVGSFVTGLAPCNLHQTPRTPPWLGTDSGSVSYPAPLLAGRARGCGF